MAEQIKHPGKLLRKLMEERRWTREVVASITGYTAQTISSISTGRSRVRPEMAVALAAAFGNDPAEWLKADADYQLTLVEGDTATMKRMAALYGAAPIVDMQKRGWIKSTNKPDELEAELEQFFGGPITSGVSFPCATKRTVALEHLNAAEQAWCFRARQLAEAYPVVAYNPTTADAIAKRLRRLAAFPETTSQLPGLFSKFGIRFVIVEPLPGARIDGAAFWIDESPAIAVSARWDRIDAFWFTVAHEFAHIRNRDAYSADANLIGEDDRGGVSIQLSDNESEANANDYARELLVPQEELRSFVGRVSPLYSAERIVQFAHRIRMHPGIIVGQLQHLGELGYSAHRGFLAKIREIATSAAFTDGWGQEIAPGVLDGGASI